MDSFTRRDFLTVSALGMCSFIISTGLSGCNSEEDGETAVAVDFLHGVASGDPLSDRVIIWTRVTPEDTTIETLSVTYEAATDKAFSHIVHNGTVNALKSSDYTIKIDLQNLSAGTVYYYRFRSNGKTSATGRTKTLPSGSVESVKMAVFSCANYPKGYFNAYAEAAKDGTLDVALHLGDYIYEHGMYEADGVTPAYATENATAIGRVLPTDNDTELLTLEDYRKRYALYRTDTGAQSLHSALPMIAVWDDHEVANDAYKSGAENHDEATEGSFESRKLAALQAYFEWLPIRPVDENDRATIYRSFEFGNLVALHMLDTRLIGRDKQLSYSDYFTTTGFDAATFQADLTSVNRTILGSNQLTWLQGKLTTSTATWQVLGQQVLMGKMSLPAEIITLVGQLDSVTDEEKTALLTQLNTLIGELATIKGRILQGDTTVTDTEKARVETVMPYNLDAWDGYYYEREVLFATALQADRNLVVLAGDTHNAWANDLKDTSGNQVGVEFATQSVSSPGMEEYVGLADDTTAAQFAGAIELLIDGLAYTNQNRRGFMTVTFTSTEATAQWSFLSTTDSTDYSLASTFSKSLKVRPGSGNRKIEAV